MDSEADESKQGELPARSLWNLGSDPFTRLYSHQVNQRPGPEARARGRILHNSNAVSRSMSDIFSAAARARTNDLQNQLQMIHQNNPIQLSRVSLPNMNNLTSPLQYQRRRSLFETDLNGDNQQQSQVHQLELGAQLRNGMLFANEKVIADVNGGASAIDSKPKGYIIVPCSARGMPVDHNYKTGYFVIYNNTKHGDELTCSFQACRNSGVKFRYCSHCKIPVAKRNFNKNHSHIAEDKKNEEKHKSKHIISDISSVGDASRSSFGSQRNTACAIVSGESDNSVSTSQSTFSTDIRKDKTSSLRYNQVSSSSGLKRKRDGISRHQDESDSRNKLNDEQIMISESSRKESNKEIKQSRGDMSIKKQLWISLLEKRPSSEDKEALSEWLSNVLAISDQIKSGG